MTQRRNLIEGLSETPQVERKERDFVFGEKGTAESSNEAVESTTVIASSTSYEVLPQFKGRVPLTTRCRPELASALKRASLQRQLDDVEPNRMQDILESALEDWLRRNGYAQ